MSEQVIDTHRLYEPLAAIVVYANEQDERYVEHYGFNEQGCPVNAHPLTAKEGEMLAQALTVSQDQQAAFLKSDGVISTSILSIDWRQEGTVVWFTPPSKRELFFVAELGLPNGHVQVPALIWKATKSNLSLYAVKGSKRPTANTPLHYGPFFNQYSDGRVCMGTVDVKIASSASLEAFTDAWENYFFNSYFSHLLDGINPVKGNLVTLYKHLIQTNEKFPLRQLRQNGKTLKDILR